MRRWVVVLLFGLAGPARAEPVTFEFTGTVQNWIGSSPLAPTVSWGMPIRGTVTYDPAVPGVSLGSLPPPFRAPIDYSSPGGITFEVAGQTFSSPLAPLA